LLSFEGQMDDARDVSVIGRHDRFTNVHRDLGCSRGEHSTTPSATKSIRPTKLVWSTKSIRPTKLVWC
jgi:hypothetical protein